MDKTNDDVCSSPNSQSSPEANCPICLEKPNDKSFTDSCLHQFCFTCLLEWSKVKAECPLCKQSFKSIKHNVRSTEDYEQYYLSATPVEEGMLGFSHMLRYEPNRPGELPSNRITAVASYLQFIAFLEEMFGNNEIPVFSSISRRSVYEQGLWVQRIRDVTGQVIDCSPEFYRSDPALLNPLVPWLNRELNVLLNANEAHVQFVVIRILELITQTPIQSSRFADAVSIYIGRHTEHFVHEFYSFASSPYDITDYDRYAVYVERGNLAHDVSGDDGNDSDVQVVSSLAPTSPTGCIHLDDSDSQDCVVVDSIPPRQVSPEVICLVSDTDDDVVQENIHVETENNRPAPSCRIPLKKPRLEEKNVHMEKPSTDNVNVSINIAHSSRTRSSSSESSSCSYNPSISKSSSTKSKGKLNGSKKTSKSKSSLSKNKSSKSKGKTTSKGYKHDKASSSISKSYWNEGSLKYERKSETDGHSRSNPPDPYGPSCSYHSSNSSRSLSPEYKPGSKSKYSKKRLKRQAYW